MRSLIIKLFVIVLAASANLALGLYWYGSEFSRQWANAAHRSGAQFHHPSTEQWIAAAAGSLITAIVLSFVGHRMAGKNAGFFRREIVGVAVAAIAWLGFAAATAARHYAFLGHSQELLALDSGFELAGMLVMGLLVALV